MGAPGSSPASDSGEDNPFRLPQRQRFPWLLIVAGLMFLLAMAAIVVYLESSEPAGPTLPSGFKHVR
jgi:hypothetical protein